MNATPSLVAATSSIVEIEVAGILFDMDGVLVRSTSGDERCWTRWAEGHQLVDGFDLRRTHGRRAADTIREHLPHITDAELRQHLADLDSFAEEEQFGIEPYPGARKLLSSIPSHRWTVVTSASEKMMRSRLVSVGISAPRSVVGGDTVTRGRPDPEGYLRGAALLTRSPHECLVIEDAPAGIRAGRSAGCQVLAVASSHDVAELRQADWVLLHSIRSSSRSAILHHSNCVSRRSLPCTERARKMIAVMHAPHIVSQA
jgi:sugar-phosphatase